MYTVLLAVHSCPHDVAPRCLLTQVRDRNGSRAAPNAQAFPSPDDQLALATICTSSNRSGVSNHRDDFRTRLVTDAGKTLQVFTTRKDIVNSTIQPRHIATR